jgi:hypothetical protein
MHADALSRENQLFDGTGGVSAGNHRYGFAPAFLDTRTYTIYPSCFSDGRPAPVHTLQGLPRELVKCSDSGAVYGVTDSVVSGFVRGHCFYTRAQASRWVARRQRRQRRGSDVDSYDLMSRATRLCIFTAMALVASAMAYSLGANGCDWNKGAHRQTR